MSGIKFTLHRGFQSKTTWDSIPGKISDGLKGCRDLCALECLANDPRYAKPDSQKIFLLWKAKNIVWRTNNVPAITIDVIEGFTEKHPWVASLFIGTDFVRFPFNTWDAKTKNMSGIAGSLSWESIREDLKKEKFEDELLQLPRWSTASRSCFVMIPEHADNLGKQDPDNVDDGLRLAHGVEREVDSRVRTETLYPNLPEWDDYEPTSSRTRFKDVVGDPATAANTGKGLFGNQYKLYSVKTGVSFVGSFYEGLHGKNLLEANSSMAMRRSDVIASMYNSDETFGIQTEVLTITAPLIDGRRDGFQVRDLSCLREALHYVPGSAIPYARAAFDGKNDDDCGAQCEFWRKAFAVPLGRAKARLFLNYGLLHTSANAQNFLVGFCVERPKQFVTRDVGDTSWHDDYLTRYIQGLPSGKKAYNNCHDESTAPIHHMLRETTSNAYPPPRMIRLAAYEVIGHGFDEKLLSPLKTQNSTSSTKDGCGWTELHVYHFATGVLDGFRSFMEEAFGFGELYPLGPDNLEDKEIKTCGEQGPYPYETNPPIKKQKYEALVEKLKQESADMLMGKAAAVRRRGTAAMGNDKQAFGRYPFRILLNAEEAFLCGGLEVKLGLWGEKDGHVAERLVKLFEGAWPKVVIKD
jgi:hypothetical protein